MPAATMANATCPLGIAAYGLWTVWASSWAPALSGSANPSSGTIRGGATGTSR